DVTLDEEHRKAKVTVPEDQTSLAIGKGGQNVRLASKLTGYSIDIEKSTTAHEPREPKNESATAAPEQTAPEPAMTKPKTQPKARKKSAALKLAKPAKKAKTT
ncbi:KH domain-containing protein, partial [Candidatus Berkelbacteria bacterium]|nr:KH domain-containing protein [Candidatus Berkelbacteria bacterium]